MDNSALTHRLNRAIGQIESIKKMLNSEREEDCMKTLQQLKASINALKKFGEAYISLNMEHCLSTNKDLSVLKKDLKTVIQSAFFL